MVFRVVVYWCECWSIKKAECQRTNAFELWCWRRLLKVPLTAQKSNQPSLEEINPTSFRDGMMLMLKLQYFVTWCEEPTHWKRPWCWKRMKAKEEGSSRGWDGWIASPTQWALIWANYRELWTEEPGTLQSMGSQRIGQDLGNEQQQHSHSH